MSTSEKIEQGIWQPGIFGKFPEVSYGGLTKLYVPKSNAKKNITIRPKLSHGNNVVVIDKEMMLHPYLLQEKMTATDGLLTDLKHVDLTVTTADCTPVALFDPVHHAIGIFHSGWKGTAALLVKNGIEKMQLVYGTKPKDLLVSIGPSIAPEDYEVDTPVFEKFKETYSPSDLEKLFHEHAPGKYFLDVPFAIKLQLINSGVEEKNIEQSEYFTSKNPYLFPSARIAGGVKNVQPMLFVMSLK